MEIGLASSDGGVCVCCGAQEGVEVPRAARNVHISECREPICTDCAPPYLREGTKKTLTSQAVVRIKGRAVSEVHGEYMLLLLRFMWGLCNGCVFVCLVMRF